LCYLVIKGELFIITYNSSKNKQKIVFGGSYWVNNCRELEQFVKTSGISSNTVLYTYYGQAIFVFKLCFNLIASEEKNEKN